MNKFLLTILTLFCLSSIANTNEIMLIYPVNSEEFEVNESVKISWVADNSNSLFKLEYSLSSDKSWILIADSLKDLEYTWTVPDTATDNLNFRVTKIPIIKSVVNIVWADTIGGDDEDFGLRIIETKDGGYITVGTTKSTNGDIPHNNGSSDLWIVKFDNDGSIMWNKTYGGQSSELGYKIIQLDDGGYLVAGETSSFKLGNTQKDSYSNGWLLRLDPEGEIIWNKTYGGYRHDKLTNILKTKEGDFLLIGNSSSYRHDLSDNNGGKDIWLMKVDWEGDLLWSKSYGGSRTDRSYSVVENNNSYYIVGTTYSNDYDLESTKAITNFVVGRFSFDGELHWLKSFGGSETEFGLDIIPNKNNGVLALGYTYSKDGDVNSRAKLSTSSNTDGWLIAVDSNGILTHERAYGESGKDISHCMAMDKEGNIIIGGYADAYHHNVKSYGKDDAVLYKLDKDGNEVWYTAAGGVTHDIFYDLIIDSNNDYVLVGKFGQSNEFMDMFVVKYRETMLKNVSDETLNSSSIVKPFAVINIDTIDMSEVYLNESKDSIITQLICNKGKANLIISNITIDGINSRNFNYSNIIPDTLEPGECIDLQISFYPDIIGEKVSNLTFLTNAEGSERKVFLRGIGKEFPIDEPTFSYFVYMDNENEYALASIILEVNENIKLEVYDNIGRRILNVFEGEGEKGLNEFKINFSEIQSGRYYVRLTTPTITKTEILEVVR